MKLTYGSQNEEAAFIRRIAAPPRVKRSKSKRKALIGASVALLGAGAVCTYVALQNDPEMNAHNTALQSEEAFNNALVQFEAHQEGGDVDTEEPALPRVDPEVEKKFNLLDTDQNGLITESQFFSGVSAQWDRELDRLYKSNLDTELKNEIAQIIQENRQTQAKCVTRIFVKNDGSGIDKEQYVFASEMLDEFCGGVKIHIPEENEIPSGPSSDPVASSITWNEPSTTEPVSAPTFTEAPVAGEEPTSAGEEPTYTKAPFVTGEEPSSTVAPVADEEPTTSGEVPFSTEGPVAGEEPTYSDAPFVTGEEPSSTEGPVAGEEPTSAGEEPTYTEASVAGEEPSYPESPSRVEGSAPAGEEPSSTDAPIADAEPVDESTGSKDYEESGSGSETGSKSDIVSTEAPNGADDQSIVPWQDQAIDDLPLWSAPTFDVAAPTEAPGVDNNDDFQLAEEEKEEKEDIAGNDHVGDSVFDSPAFASPEHKEFQSSLESHYKKRMEAHEQRLAFAKLEAKKQDFMISLLKDCITQAGTRFDLGIINKSDANQTIQEAIKWIDNKCLAFPNNHLRFKNPPEN